jgi:hypothetical protein
MGRVGDTDHKAAEGPGPGAGVELEDAAPEFNGLLGAGIPAQSCRRAHTRFKIAVTVKVTELSETGTPSASWECTTIDVSRGGLGLTSKRMAYDGRGVLIEVPPAARLGARLLHGTVRSCVYVEGQGYRLGVQFSKLPDTPAVRSWLLKHGLAPSFAPHAH